MRRLSVTTAAAVLGLAIMMPVSATAIVTAHPGTAPHGRTGTHRSPGTTGTRWAATRPRELVSLYSVSCAAQGNCVAVGDSYSAVGPASLSVHWNGTDWAEPSAPVPTDLGLHYVACAGDSTCMAIDNEGGLLEWDGNTWHFPSGFTNGLLNGVLFYAVSCASPVSCVTVGLSRTSMIGWVWDGQTWTEHDPGSPPGMGQGR